MQKLVLSGYINVPVVDVEAIKSALNEHIRLTRQEPGCVVFTVTQRELEPTIFDVYEEFINKQAFEDHQKRVATSHWGHVSKNAERHYKIIEK